MASYPEHEKLAALNGANQTVGDFLEWLSERGWLIAEHHARTDSLIPVRRSRDGLIALFFEIDVNRLEHEKRSILEALRSPPTPDNAA